MSALHGNNCCCIPRTCPAVRAACLAAASLPSTCRRSLCFVWRVRALPNAPVLPSSGQSISGRESWEPADARALERHAQPSARRATCVLHTAAATLIAARYCSRCGSLDCMPGDILEPPRVCLYAALGFIHTLEIIARILSEVVNRERLCGTNAFVCLFVCFFV